MFRQTEMCTTEPLILEPSSVGVETIIENLERYKLPGINHIPAKLIQARGNTLHSESHRLISFIFNKEELPQ
jgi:hypothetical protein